MIIDNSLKNVKAINMLAKNYNTLDYYVKLASLLKSVYPEEDFYGYSKYELHKFFNDVLIQHYKGEEIHKYKLFEHYTKKTNIIGAFEIKVNNSRVDFLTINGHTTSFEIKSELDNLSKISKQMADYKLAFEYNYLVVDESHIEKVLEIIPDSFGLWSFKDGKYKKEKRSILNDQIDPNVQLSLLTKKELLTNFAQYKGVIKDIVKFCDASTINNLFKVTLKNRYRTRWEFLVAHQENIFPIDVQFFFNTNISPNSIYCI